MNLRNMEEDPYKEQLKEIDNLICNRRSIIKRDGDINIMLSNLKKRSKYLQDIYTTLVDVRWRWTLLVFFISFIVSWLGFAFVYFMILKIHGDDLVNTDENGDPVAILCVANVQTFTGAFLYSLETQHTIGYGYRYTTEECPPVIIVMVIQSITGVMIQAFMVGVVFAKLTRPKSRRNTLFFSRFATVCLRNGKYNLVFRVADMRKSFIIGASVKALLIRKHETQEGEVVPFFQCNVDIATEGGAQDLFFMWPLNIVHEINEKSPFFNMSAIDLMNDQFEFIVYLEGTAESTGTSMQARFSYLPSNILWGHRFVNLISYVEETENYSVDFSKFHTTVEIPTPLCSAKDFYHLQNELKGHMISSVPLETDDCVCLEPDYFEENANYISREY